MSKGDGTMEEELLAVTLPPWGQQNQGEFYFVWPGMSSIWSWTSFSFFFSGASYERAEDPIQLSLPSYVHVGRPFSDLSLIILDKRQTYTVGQDRSSRKR